MNTNQPNTIEAQWQDYRKKVFTKPVGDFSVHHADFVAGALAALRCFCEDRSMLKLAELMDEAKTTGKHIAEKML